MAKLSHKITTNNNNDNTNQNNNQNQKIGFTLSTKVDNNEENTQKEQTQETDIEVDVELIKKPISIAQIIEKIGMANFGTLTKEDVDTLFPPETEVNSEEVKKKIIDKVLKSEISLVLEKYADEINQKYANLLAVIKDNEEKIGKQEIQVKNLTMQVEDAEELVYKTEKKYADTVPVEDLILDFIRSKISNQYTLKIVELLKEGYKNGGKNGTKFIFGFLKGFVFVEEAILTLGADEKENLDLLHNSGKNLLSNISELTIPERRPILDIVANLYNSYMNEYDFVSPEQTLQIDPNIHNADGLGGSVVKEGKSFAVVRRETKKPVYYADIKTR
ncbi:MAG: hypothetical protein JXL97_05555 [Bacteroidales bacterium]|nr:hypothetical protein [Bacteroidales bacterium]